MLYKEGDVWTEKGKTWTMKNGVKRTVSKFSKVRKDLQTPLCCPKCSKTLKHVDEKFYTFNRVCMDCTIEFEHELVKQGKYQEYEKARILANAKGYILDMDKFFSEYLESNIKESFVTEDGDVEAWIGDPTKKVKEVVKPKLDELKEQFAK